MGYSYSTVSLSISPFFNSRRGGEREKEKKQGREENLVQSQKRTQLFNFSPVQSFHSPSFFSLPFLLSSFSPFLPLILILPSTHRSSLSLSLSLRVPLKYQEHISDIRFYSSIPSNPLFCKLEKSPAGKIRKRERKERKRQKEREREIKKRKKGKERKGGES